MATYKRVSRKRGKLEGHIPSLQAVAEQLRRDRLPVPAAASTRYTPPLTELRHLSASRLLPARYSDSVLTRLADSPEELHLVYALDNATNERLLAESNSVPGLLARELVFDIPYARIINAAFAHPHPQGARFSTPYRGAWYAALELATAKAEVLFHRSVQFNEIVWTQPEHLDYDHYQADFTGAFHDLRQPIALEPENQSAEAEVRVPFLDPGSYMASQGLAERLLHAGSLGVVYPSARRPGGTCLACFRPGTVANVRKRDLHRLTWYPEAPPTFSRIPRKSDGPPSVSPLRAVPPPNAPKLSG